MENKQIHRELFHNFLFYFYLMLFYFIQQFHQFLIEKTFSLILK